jgi:hypothetical protein
MSWDWCSFLEVAFPEFHENVVIFVGSDSDSFGELIGNGEATAKSFLHGRL